MTDLVTSIPAPLEWIPHLQERRLGVRPREIDFGRDWRIHPDAAPQDTCAVWYAPDAGIVYAEYHHHYIILGYSRPFKTNQVNELLKGWDWAMMRRFPVVWVWKKLNRFYKNEERFARSFALRYGLRRSRTIPPTICDSEGRPQWRSFKHLGSALIDQKHLGQRMTDGRVLGYLPIIQEID